MAKKETEKCNCHHSPVFAVIVLILGVLWLLSDLGYLSKNVPWFPLIVVLAAIAMLVKRYWGCNCHQ